MYELNCRYDSRRSFYGKAFVKEEDDGIVFTKLLYSYGTLVAIYSKDTTNGGSLKIYTYLGNYSQTTTRHQKEFFKQNGLNDNQIRELFKKGVLEVK